MASSQKDDQWQLKSGAAALATCVVQTLNESDPTFEKRFLANLEKAYREFADGDRYGSREVTAALEMFSWTRELLTGWNMVTGQGRPLLK